MNKTLYILSNISNLIPLIPFIFTYRKNERPYNLIFFIFFIGFLNDLLSYLRYVYFPEYQFFLKINDVYKITCLGLWLYFFNQLSKEGKSKKDFLVFGVGLILLLLDWAYISKYNINSLYAEIYINIIFILLCLKRINYQIINVINVKYRFDPVLIFCICMTVFYSFHLLAISIYSLEIPLHIKIKPTLFNIIPSLNIITNIIYTITFFFLPKRNNLLVKIL